MRNILSILSILCLTSMYSQEIKDLPQLDPIDIDTITSNTNYLLRVDMDTLYIISKGGVDEYKNCRIKYRELYNNCSEYQKVETIINAVSIEFDSLNYNIQTLEDKYEIILQENIRNNNVLKEQNETISKNLEAAKEELSEAKHKIKQERWNSSGMKILWGAGGLVIGTLVGGFLIAVSN